ncbi:MAG: ABC transporter substrate-binding protein, partial [Candidatus Electryonea clarkiae]|nr:ABC transporter substrate-binding protein [Candidatus Electryonea clarkiae]
MKERHLKRFKITGYLISILSLWTIVVGVSLFWNYYIHNEEIQNVARIEAHTSIKKDILYRYWNTMQGGIYVPVTEQTPPNPYLDFIEERDITTPNGKKLTLMNPSYMTRQIHEIGGEKFNLHGHITSLDPIRPANAPDVWETEALTAFEEGVDEYSSVEDMDGSQYLRLMIPLITEEKCLTCHSIQGYEVGDVRGGISVSVPLVPFQEASQSQMYSITIGHFLAWLLGIFGLIIGARYLKQRFTEREKSEEAVIKSERKFRGILESAPLGILIMDSAGKIQMVNDQTRNFFNYDPEELIGKHIECLIPRRFENHSEFREKYLANPEFRPMGKNLDLYALRKDGTEFPVEVSLSPLEIDEDVNVIIGVVDISNRKIAELKLIESETSLTKAQEIAHIGNWELSVKDNKSIWSKEMYRIHGIPEDEKPSFKTLKKRIHPDDVKIFDDAIRRGFAGAAPEAFEYRIYLDNEEIRFIQAKNESFFDDSGNLSRMIGTLQDITERKQAEQKLNDTLDQLQRHNRLMTGREERVMKLKSEINNLLKEFGRDIKYGAPIDTPDEIMAYDLSDILQQPKQEKHIIKHRSPATINILAAEEAGLEKTILDISFIPTICTAPLLYAHSHGYFAENGIDVNLKSALGWSGLKELMVHGRVDAAHMLAPMPFACSLGIDGKQTDIRLAAIQNVNGQALTLSKRLSEISDVKEMKGLTFGVPYRFSMQYYLLNHFLAENGVDPLNDVRIIEVAPPRMPYYLEKGWVDGIFAPEPFNLIPVNEGTGFIFVLSKDIWNGHPCCSLAVKKEFIDLYPNTYNAMLESVLLAEKNINSASSEEKKLIAREISTPEYLNREDTTPVEQALSGHFHDGQEEEHTIPDYVKFEPYPREDFGIWMLSQMQRWGQLAGEIDYKNTVNNTMQSETFDLAEKIGFKSMTEPKVDEFISFAGNDPFSFMLKQPFCAYREEPETLDHYELSKPLKQRLSEIISHLVDFISGERLNMIEQKSSGEIGYIEQLINENLINMVFTKEEVQEQKEKLEI